MTAYSIVLFLHIASALAFFVANGFEWVSSTLLRSASTADQVRSWMRVFRVSPPLSGVSLLLLILTGGHLVVATAAIKQGWMIVSLAGILIGILMGIFLILPRTKAIRAALPSGNEPLSQELLARLKDPALAASVRVRNFLALGIVCLMTLKTPLHLSLGILAGFLVLGFLISIPVFSKS